MSNSTSKLSEVQMGYLSEIFRLMVKEVTGSDDYDKLALGEMGINYTEGTIYVRNPHTGELFSPNSIPGASNIADKVDSTGAFNADKVGGIRFYGCVSGTLAISTIISQMSAPAVLIANINYSNYDTLGYPGQRGVITINKVDDNNISATFYDTDTLSMYTGCYSYVANEFEGWRLDSGSRHTHFGTLYGTTEMTLAVPALISDLTIVSARVHDYIAPGATVSVNGLVQMPIISTLGTAIGSYVLSDNVVNLIYDGVKCKWTVIETTENAILVVNQILADRIIDLSADNSQTIAAYETLLGEVDKLSQSVSSQYTMITNMDTTINDLDNKVISLTTSVSNANVTIANNNATISALQKEIDEAELNISKLQTTISLLEDKIAELSDSSGSCDCDCSGSGNYNDDDYLLGELDGVAPGPLGDAGSFVDPDTPEDEIPEPGETDDTIITVDPDTPEEDLEPNDDIYRFGEDSENTNYTPDDTTVDEDDPLAPDMGFLDEDGEYVPPDLDRNDNVTDDDSDDYIGGISPDNDASYGTMSGINYATVDLDTSALDVTITDTIFNTGSMDSTDAESSEDDNFMFDSIDTEIGSISGTYVSVDLTTLETDISLEDTVFNSGDVESDEADSDTDDSFVFNQMTEDVE